VVEFSEIWGKYRKNEENTRKVRKRVVFGAKCGVLW
jgi:hypothetical protein